MSKQKKGGRPNGAKAMHFMKLDRDSWSDLFLKDIKENLNGGRYTLRVSETKEYFKVYLTDRHCENKNKSLRNDLLKMSAECKDLNTRYESLVKLYSELQKELGDTSETLNAEAKKVINLQDVNSSLGDEVDRLKGTLDRANYDISNCETTLVKIRNSFIGKLLFGGLINKTLER